MANTLDWDDDLDSCVALEAVEKCFDIDLCDLDLRHVYRMGELFDVVWRKLPGDRTGRKCASAMAFYRLRSALALASWRFRERTGPQSDLAWLDRFYTRAFVKDVEDQCGLRLPKPRLTWMGKLGWWAVLLPVAWFPFRMLADRFEWLVPDGAGIAYFLSIVLLAWALTKFDPGRLPKDCTSMRGLVDETVRLSYGRLVRHGADARKEEVWRMLRIVLAAHSVLPAKEMTRDTVLLRSIFDENYGSAN